VKNAKNVNSMKNAKSAKIVRNAKSAKKRAKYAFRDNLELSALVLPGAVLLFVFCYLPMFGVVIAFKEFNANLGILGSPWKGLENFRFFFESQDAWRVLRNTVLYGINFQITGTLAALALAVLLYAVRSRAALKYYQTTMILPNFLSMVLVSFIAYAILNPKAGALNAAIRLLGGTGADWYASPKYWPFILTIVHIWKGVGLSSVIYYAALMGIDESLFEAARIDGANRLHEVRYIMLPELSSVVSILLILGLGSLINGDFGLFYQIPMNIGVLYPATDIINTYVFRGLQQATNMGGTAAIGLFQSVVSLLLIVGGNFAVKRISADNSLF
jgi:putative aldouronate transport system permease protein